MSSETMQQPMPNNAPAQADDDFIDLTPYINAMWRHKIPGTIVIFTLFWVGFAASFTQPVLYTAEMIAAYAPSRDVDANAAAGKFGVLGALGGTFGLSGAAGRQSEDLATLRSNQFAARFIANENLTNELVAKKWDMFSQQMESDPKLYDETKKELTSKGQTLFEKNSHIREFAKMVEVSEDKRSTLVTIRLSWWQREKAQTLLKSYLDLLNSHLRDAEIQDAQRNIDYLMQQVNATDIVELKKTFFGLIETQQKKIMLANTRPDYAFRIIDPPLKPFKKSKPSRLIFAAAGATFGFFLFISWAIFTTQKKEHSGAKGQQ